MSQLSFYPSNAKFLGLGNLYIVAATEMAGISFSKLARFASVLNMKFIEESAYYRLRGDYVYPEINNAWEMERKKMVSSLVSYFNIFPVKIIFLLFC